MTEHPEKLLRTVFKSSVGAIFAVSMYPVMAQPVFDTWTVSGGTISVTCPGGFTCETLNTGDGFAQVQWVEAGATYIQTIITDQGATGNPTNVSYSDESFVKLGNDVGISSKQHYSQDDTVSGLGNTFENTTLMNTGWANPTPDASNPEMDVTQILTSDLGAAAGDEFNSTFHMQLIHDASGNISDRDVTLNQVAGLGDGVTASTDAQEFLSVRRQGLFTTAGDITLDATSFDSNNNPLNGGNVTWANEDDVMIRWIGQSIDLDTQGTSVFGFEGITNFTTPDEATTFSTTSTGITVDGNDLQGYGTPYDWDTTFGNTPPSL